jgi:hypothetical protein
VRKILVNIICKKESRIVAKGKDQTYVNDRIGKIQIYLITSLLCGKYEISFIFFFVLDSYIYKSIRIIFELDNFV